MDIRKQRNLHKILSAVFSMAMAGLFIYGTIKKKPANVLDAAGSTIFLAWLLYGIEILIKRHLPISVHYSFSIFLFLANGLGSALRVYDLIPWWDILLHTASGYLLCIGAMYYLRSAGEHKKLSTTTYILFVLAFNTLCACLWETIEFIADQFFGANMQIRESGVLDTMSDILCAMGGSLVWMVMYLLQKKYGFKDITYYYVKDFEKPEYFATYDKKTKQYVFPDDFGNTPELLNGDTKPDENNR